MTCHDEGMNSVAAQLTKDHQELHALLLCLAEDAKAPLPGTLQATWTTFEKRLLRHMETEEHCLLPLIELSDPAEFKRVRTEHARIRGLLTELGVAIELHTVREANISELIDLLEAHAKHENTTLYHMAESKLSAEAYAGIARLIKQGVGAAAAAVSGKTAAAKRHS
ncbi:MAG TPA: hemerythrin domain-containing protein [Polyangiaceae bacterium]|nr:hemerythrin domain-containing protein [Polyangiaceae bacterium]